MFFTFGSANRIWGMKDEKEIIERVLQGETDAFREIVDRYGGMVLRICARILNDLDDAQDMAQETFVRAWSSLGRFSPRYSMATWLRTIACRLCYDELRSSRRASMKISDSSISSYITEDSETAFIWKEALMQLRNATASLSPMQRIVFILHEIEQMSADEIAAATGFTKIQIKSNLYFARKAVRERIGENILQYEK